MTKDLVREYTSFEKDESKMLGVDVNIKHNIFACSDNSTIDLDRDKLKGFAKLLNRIDSKKSKCKTKEDREKVTEYYKPRTDKWLQRYKGELQYRAYQLVEHAQQNGYNHIVMEDLKLMGRMFSKEENTGLKYSRLAKLIHLNTLDDLVSSICSKKGVQLSIVNPAYTSQECCDCGYVSRNNRQTQEDFTCVECGHKDNADVKSAKIIKKRVASDVHCAKLNKLNKVSWFIPKPIGHKQIKTFLLDLFDDQSVVEQPNF